MILKISKFAQIKEAEITMDGITVIAGYNDTGKSTIGKVLYSIFNSLCSIDKRISVRRRRDIDRICQEIMSGIEGNSFADVLYDKFGKWVTSGTVNPLTQKILQYDGELTIENFRTLLLDELELKDTNPINDYLESSYNRISAIKNTPDRILYNEVVESFFSYVFCAQMIRKIVSLHQDIMDGIFEAVALKERLKDIYRVFRIQS